MAVTASGESIHWYKGNTHTHTLWSDGNDFPDMVTQLTGKELYIRAAITSSKPHPNASYPNQTEMAWTQPVGWVIH